MLFWLWTYLWGYPIPQQNRITYVLLPWKAFLHTDTLAKNRQAAEHTWTHSKANREKQTDDTLLLIEEMRLWTDPYRGFRNRKALECLTYLIGWLCLVPY